MYTFVLTDDEGNEQTVETDEIPATITDNTGNTYEIDENGTITPISAPSGVALNDEVKNTPRPDIATLEFEEIENTTKYAVDQYRDIYAQVTEFFLKYKSSDNDMIASAKFMTPGGSDEIFVRITDRKSAFNPEKVRFITSKGKEYKGEYDGSNGWKLTLVGSEANDGQELYVVQETGTNEYATLAKLNIFSYEPQSINVQLVPVNGFSNNFTASKVESELNKIYGKVGITCKVTMAPPFDYEPLKNNSFDVTGSGLFSTETADMKNIIAAYYGNENYTENAAVLFIIENVTGNEGIAGDMPRGKQFGYLFPGSDEVTVAHEIGHGVFKLEHPSNRSVTANSFREGALPDNLMEYNGGTTFVKLQWDAIHSPGHVIGVFEQDADAMAASKFVDIEKFWKWIKTVGNSSIDYNYVKFRTDFIGSKSIEEITLSTNNKIELMVEFFNNNGSVNVSKPKINIRFENQHTIFGLLFQTKENKEAFELQVNSFHEYSLLLEDLNITIDYNDILSQYESQFKKAGTDCDKLDVIYERIPIYISLMKDDNTLIEHFLGLSDCAIDNIGTNESVAVTKLLSSIKNPNILYEKLFPCPKAYERKEQGWYHITRTDVFNVKAPEFLKSLLTNFGGGVGFVFGVADGVYGMTQDNSTANATGVLSRAESMGAISQINPSLDEAKNFTIKNGVPPSAYLLEKFGEVAAKDPIVGKNQQWFKNHFEKTGKVLGKGWGVSQVYFVVNDLTPTKKQYLEQMLFDCMKYCVSGTSEAVGGTSNYLNIPHRKFENMNEVQTYLDKMWQVILTYSLGKSISNDAEYAKMKNEVLNVLVNDKYFYGKR